MKKVQRSSFKLNPIAASIAIAMASQFAAGAAYAGSGWGTGVNTSNAPMVVQTYYANSPAGLVPALDPVTGLTSLDPVTNLPVVANTGTALRKFVDTLPGMGATNANNLGQYIPVAVPEKWVDLNGNATNDDYYEIAAVEFAEKMHTDLSKPTHLRGYVQLSTAKNPGKQIPLIYPNGTPILDAKGVQVLAYDNPHHLGPIINSTTGVAVRVKFSNYLPVGGELFLPVDTTITGAGLGPDGVNKYTQNRAEMHLVGGQSPWISAGSPHQWVAPAGETAAYAANLGKGASVQNVPDMANPGNGSNTLYFPNTQSARFMFIQDRTSGLTRLNSYAGLEAGYFVTDAAEQALITAGSIPAAADTLPLIIEDKTFVPANVAQQDAKWDTTYWGQPGDLWFPHVYEPNQDTGAANGVNPVGRWDFGPLFWPIFAATAPLPSGVHGDASFTPEAYADTPLINGTAYPTLTLDPKAYRFRILNASSDRFINLGWYKADATASAPQLDQNGNPIFDANGNQLFFTNTEVKMVPALADATGAPLVPVTTGAGLPYDPTCLCEYPTLPQIQPAIQFSGPNRAWPTDGRNGGAPDPAAVGPDFIVIGNDGGLLPNPVDVPSQPVTYEQNRRSVTVSNIYGYGLLMAPAERSDVIVDFSAYAGQTLILYNDAPAPTPFNDERNDYYTANPDMTGTGGTYSTKPGYGPNTRTMMQVKVNGPLSVPPVAPAAPFNAATLLTALPAAYGLSQPTPIVPESAYNAAFGTTDADLYAHVATGSIAQPTLDFSTSGTVTLTGLTIITSGGTQNAAGGIVGNVIPGTGQNYDPANPPVVNFVLPAGATFTTPASAIAIVDPTTRQITGFQAFNPGSGYSTAPSITFTNPPGTFGVGAQATVTSSKFNSILVQTKAEQELFDASGRYNSTGGVELPLTSDLTQTTVPLNYTDSATEIIGDSEVQIWKLVDNGFWSNSIHFDFVDVQLINRVGWDGTVKAPATNEVGWKDTVRLNPLEDVVVAMRAKHPAVPFGLPQSLRTQDPSVALGGASRGLAFTADPGVLSPAGVPLLTTTTNAAGNYDNEYFWSSAVLGHSEDDFMRPVVYQPIVTKPAAPTNLGGSLGKLTWTDTTPAATSLGNVQNEIGFKVLRATYSVNGNLGTYAQIGNAPANATSYTDATEVAGTDYSYEVAAWNVAGSTTSTPYTEITAPAVPTWAGVGVLVNANGTVTLTWNKVTGATGYIVTANGVTLPLIAAANGGQASQSSTVTLALGSVYSFTIAAQRVKFGLTATSAASAAVTADLTLPVAPAAPAMGATTITTQGRPTISWSASAGATGYLVAVNGGAPVAVAGTTYTFPATPNAGSLALGSSYSVTVAAQTTKFGITVTSAASPVTVDLTPAVTPATPTGVTASLSGTTVTLSWNSVVNATAYLVQVSTNGGAFTTLPTVTTASTTATVTAGNTYVYQVAAQSTKTVSAYVTTSAPSAYTKSNNVVTALAAPAMGATTITAQGRPTISWSASAGATGYLVAVNGGAPVAVAGTTYTFPATPNAGSLALGSSYSVTVTTKFGTTVTSAAAPVTVDLTPAVTPATPTGVTASLSGTTVTLSWNSVVNATAYLVQVSTNGGAFTTLPTVTTASTTATVTAGNTYVYQVAAQSTKTVSAYVTTSAPSAYTKSNNVVTAPTALAVPGNLAATITAANGAVSLGWNAVNPPNGSTVGYQLIIDGGAPFTVAASPYVPVPAMATGVTHTVSIASQVTRNGLTTTSAFSTPAITVDLTAAAAPVAPATFTTTATRLTWAAATGISANATVTYAVQQSVDGGVTWAAITGSPFASNASPLNFTSAVGKNYIYRVQALATRYGLAAAASGWTTSAVLNTLPAASTTPVAAVGGATGSKKILVSWTNTSSNITGFTVQRRVGVTTTTVTLPALTTSTVAGVTTYSFTDVVPAAGSYTYHVLATSAAGSTGYTGYSNAVTAP